MSIYIINVLPLPCTRHNQNNPGHCIEASGIRNALKAVKRIYPAMNAPYCLAVDEAEAFNGNEVISIKRVTN